MIHNYTKQLRQYLTASQISEMKKRIRKLRKWNSRWFENRYLARTLYNVLNGYKLSTDKVLGGIINYTSQTILQSLKS